MEQNKPTAWRRTKERLVTYQAHCSRHGVSAIQSLAMPTLEDAINCCIVWKEEGATGEMTITTRRLEVEEIILCQNAGAVARQPIANSDDTNQL